MFRAPINAFRVHDNRTVVRVIPLKVKLVAVRPFGQPAIRNTHSVQFGDVLIHKIEWRVVRDKHKITNIPFFGDVLIQ